MSKKSVNVSVRAQTRDKSENERLIKKFCRKVKKNGVLDLVKKRRFFEKPSVKRKRKRERKLKTSREITEKHNAKFRD
jgi:small subunit ribosomal protein S21